MPYSAVFLDCFEHTRHAGKLDGEALLTASHTSVQPFSEIQFFLRAKDSVIEQASFLSSTTPALIAGCEYVCRWLEGKTLTQAHGLQKEQILQELGLEATFVHVAHLICSVIKKALST